MLKKTLEVSHFSLNQMLPNLKHVYLTEGQCKHCENLEFLFLRVGGAWQRSLMTKSISGKKPQNNFGKIKPGQAPNFVSSVESLNMEFQSTLMSLLFLYGGIICLSQS